MNRYGERNNCPNCDSPWWVATEDHKVCFCTDCGATWNRDRKPYKVGSPFIDGTGYIQIVEDKDVGEEKSHNA
jgi:hypothetical protein